MTDADTLTDASDVIGVRVKSEQGALAAAPSASCTATGPSDGCAAGGGGSRSGWPRPQLTC